MPFKIGWVSTGRGQGSMNLLNAMVKAIKEGEVNGELSFVMCSREQGEAEGSDRYIRTGSGLWYQAYFCFIQKIYA